MPVIRCPGCGAETFTVTGWADLDRCRKCGEALGAKGEPLRQASVDLLPGRREAMRYGITRGTRKDRD